MPALLQPAFRKVLNDISSIVKRSRPVAKASGSRLSLRGRWEIGRRIVKAEQNRRLHAEYGGDLLDALSRALTKKYDSGLSATSLIYMRQFYEAYPKWLPRPASEKLGWKYFRDLLSVDDKKKRDFFLKEAASNSWSTRRLMREIKKYRLAQDKAPVGKSQNNYEALSFTRGRLNIYQVITPKRRHPARSSIIIDCGFNINTEVLVKGIKKLKAGDIVEATKTSGRHKVKRIKASKDKLYTFGAFIEEVIDGDTLWADIDCGFDIWIYQKFRLRSLNAPEISTKRGLAAKRFLEKVFKKAPFFAAKTYKTDKYDRYFADIFYLPGEKDPEKILLKGTFLNQQLIDLGFAVRV